MTHEHHDREVIVERGDGSGLGMIVGIILAVIVVLAVVWFFFMGGFNGGGAGQQVDQDQQIEVPVEPGGGGEEPAP